MPNYFRNDQEREDRIREVSIRKRDRDRTTIGGVAPVDQLTGAAALTPEELALAQIRWPGARDRVTLSLEAQVLLLEQRAKSGLDLTDLTYTNTLSSVELRPGLYVKAESIGTYRLSWRP